MVPYENLQRLNQPFEEEFKIRFNGVLEKGYYILARNLNSLNRSLRPGILQNIALVFPTALMQSFLRSKH